MYIQSGIVESYVLGLASSGEISEFEQLLPHYPELKEALSDFEYNLELFAIDHEITPPPGTREKIEARLRETPAIRRTVRIGGSKRGAGSGDGSGGEPDYLRVEASRSDQIKVHKYWRTVFVIIFILSKILLALSIYYFLEYRHAEKQVRQLEQRMGK